MSHTCSYRRHLEVIGAYTQCTANIDATWPSGPHLAQLLCHDTDSSGSAIKRVIPGWNLCLHILLSQAMPCLEANSVCSANTQLGCLRHRLQKLSSVMADIRRSFRIYQGMLR